MFYLSNIFKWRIPKLTVRTGYLIASKLSRFGILIRSRKIVFVLVLKSLEDFDDSFELNIFSKKYLGVLM